MQELDTQNAVDRLDFAVFTIFEVHSLHMTCRSRKKACPMSEGPPTFLKGN